MVLDILCLSPKHNLAQYVDTRNLISTSKGTTTIIEEVNLFTDKKSFKYVIVFAAPYFSSV